MKKSLCLILAMLMLLATLVACATPSDTDDPADTTTPAPDASATTTPAADAGDAGDTPTDETTPVVEMPVIDKKFDSEVVILFWEDVEEPEFEVAEQTGDSVGDAIFYRNAAVEDQIGVELVFVGTPGNYNNQKNFVSTALNGINSGGEHDIFAGYSMIGATLAVNGYVQNLKNLDYLNFDQPYWPESLIGQATINDKLFFASGDISTNMLHMMYATFFNKQIIIDNALDDPYKLVDDGKWTYSKMFEMASNLYSDLNGDGQRGQEDAYGLCTASIHYDSFFTAAGLNTVEKDSNDQLIISPSFNSEKTITLLEDICTFMWDGQDGYHGATGAVFEKGYTLFTIDRSYMAMRRRENITFEYGIVPVPKFDDAQENYVTCLGFPYTMYAISIAAKHTEAAAATLECLCAEGFKQVTPALFEISMKLKYSSDNEASRMYDIIRESVSIDIGRIFCTELQNFTYSTFRNACTNNTANAWSSAYKMTDRKMKTLLEGINSSIAALG